MKRVMGTMTMSDDALFGESGVDREAAEQAAANRMHALGGLLATYRTRKGLSVERAAVEAGLGHMTWRRAEDGAPVRRKTYAALDTVLGVPVGTVQRALNDDLLMVDLMMTTGEPVSSGTPDAAATVAQFAHQTNPRAPRTVYGTGHATLNVDQKKLEASLATLRTPLGAVGTDSQVAIHLVERLAAHTQTPAISGAIKAILEALPDLVARQIAADQHTDEAAAG